MTNDEYLKQLAERGDGSLQAWFDAEHADMREGNVNGGEANGITSFSVSCDGGVTWFPKVSVDETRERLEADANDTREKLEADAKRYVREAAEDVGTDVLWVNWSFTLYDAILELLDRQAAITEREISKQFEEQATCLVQDKNKAETKVADLQAQVDELREKLSRAIGNAHDTLSLVDLEGNVL